MAAEPGDRAVQELRAGQVALVGEGFDVGQPGTVVDGDVQVVVADPAAAVAFAVGVVVAAVEPRAAAVGDPAEFFDIDMQQVTGLGAFVADPGVAASDRGGVSELLGVHVPNLAADGMPTVVVLDEVESMAVARSAASLAANPADVHRATDAVLTALDSNANRYPHLFFVATSNFTTALDEAFLSRSDAAILVPLPDADALQEIIVSTLLALAGPYPDLGRLAHSAAVATLTRSAVGLDGRRTRKAVFEALARRIETVENPGALSEHDLAAAFEAAVRGVTQEQEAPRAAH